MVTASTFSGPSAWRPEVGDDAGIHAAGKAHHRPLESGPAKLGADEPAKNPGDQFAD